MLIDIHRMWDAAIGLQSVDSLNTSSFLSSIVVLHCNGEISIYDAENAVQCFHYINKHSNSNNRVREADLVSVKIVELLLNDEFCLSTNQYYSIHRELFTGIYRHAGKMRDVNLSKSEVVLDGETVVYGSVVELQETLEYDINTERSFSYKEKSIEKTIKHLSLFIANLWQIHPFYEGNTRCTAVFLMKYLRYMGFEVDYSVFAKHSTYFRNALVRANYENLAMGISKTTEYLELFIDNLISEEKNELSNKILYI